MFNGIIEHTGKVRQIAQVAGGRCLQIELGPLREGLKSGASVAIAGVCLTAREFDATVGVFDVVTETLRRTNLGRLAVGDRVNLELSLRIGDRLDGHFVQGHVEGTTTVVRVDSAGEGREVWFRLDHSFGKYVVPKGSIALDGVSLTVAQLRGGQFCVALIPTTLDRTTLGTLQPGDVVNVETDVLVRAVASMLPREVPARDSLAGMVREWGA